MILPIALAMATTDNGCPAVPALYGPADRHGAGLWIGGQSFETGTIASIAEGEDPLTGAPSLVLTFTSIGATRLHAAEKGRINRQMQVWLGDCLLTAPYLIAEIRGDSIQLAATPETTALLIDWWKREPRQPA